MGSGFACAKWGGIRPPIRSELDALTDVLNRVWAWHFMQDHSARPDSESLFSVSIIIYVCVVFIFVSAWMFFMFVAPHHPS